jgi:hypothetical protein
VKRKDAPPKAKKSLLETLASMKPLKGKDRMPKIEDLPADDVDLRGARFDRIGESAYA